MSYKIKTLKCSVCAAALCLFLAPQTAPSAMAADLMRDVEPPETHLWEGLYVGATAGLTVVPNDIEVYSSSDYHEDAVGLSGGIHAGYNFQFEDMVFGLELDSSVMDIESGLRDENHHMTVDLMSSVRARLGVAVGDQGQHLPYVTAGLGVFNATAYSSDAEYSADITQFVPVLGGGFETMLTENISLRVEGLYWMLEHENIAIGSSTGGDTEAFQFEGSYGFRAGLSFHF